METVKNIKEFLKQKSKEKGRYLKQHLFKFYPDIYRFIIESTNFIVKPLSFSERVYCVINDIKEPLFCKMCSSYVPFINIRKGYRTYCTRQCADKDQELNNLREQNRQQSINWHNPEVRKNKLKEMANGKMEKYKALWIEDFNIKRKETNRKRYGTEIPMKLDYIKEKKKKTMMSRYGVEHSAQFEKTIQKMKATNLKRYGVEIVTQNKEICDKIIKTKIKNNTTFSFIFPCIGKNEKKMLDKQEIIDSCVIDRKFVVLNYHPDGYCHATNTIYEIYEKSHRYTAKKIYDQKRQL